MSNCTFPHRVIYFNEFKKCTTKIFPTYDAAKIFADEIIAKQQNKNFDAPIVQLATETVPSNTKLIRNTHVMRRGIVKTVLCKCGKNKRLIADEYCFACVGMLNNSKHNLT